MQIDPILSLAFSIHSSPGVYALLLGSGVSRAAEVPTGWDIVLDLIQKLARLEESETPADLELWYYERFQEAPDYARLLDKIAKSPTERRNLLAAYFEPDEECRGSVKRPTEAHYAIASLVASGHIKLILTTNFDRLIERAIEDVGVTPTVISTPDAVDGAAPLVHQQCCVIKLHGDYLDTRIKNTPGELEQYDDRVNSLLDRILDEYGLIVCGWSGDWDEALRAALYRCTSRRFTTYWGQRGELTDRAQRLVTCRGAVVIRLETADRFFSAIAEKVQSLTELDRPHPLSVAAASATVKRMMSDAQRKIQLHDFIHQSTEEAFESLQPIFNNLLRTRIEDCIESATIEFLSRTDIIRAITMYGGYWGAKEHQDLMVYPIERLAADPNYGVDGATILSLTVRSIPSLIVLYTAGIAAMSSKNFGMLASLLIHPMIRSMHIPSRRGRLLTSIRWTDLDRCFRELYSDSRPRWPASQWFFDNCRERLMDVYSSKVEYESAFDRFEIVRSLVFADLERAEGRQRDPSIYGPPGRFVWKHDRASGEESPLRDVQNDEAIARSLVESGLFRSDIGVFRATADEFANTVARMALPY